MVDIIFEYFVNKLRNSRSKKLFNALFLIGIHKILKKEYIDIYKIIKDLTGVENSYVLVWSIGEMDQPEELIRQGKRITDDVSTLHNINPYNVVVKVGHKLDSTKEPGIYRV